VNRPGRRRRDEVFDVVTPTPSEQRRADQHEREIRYYRLMGLCLACVLIGFFAPLPVPVRGAFCVVGALLPPVAAVIANGTRRR
jgi:hypothetical protein